MTSDTDDRNVPATRPTAATPRPTDPYPTTDRGVDHPGDRGVDPVGRTELKLAQVEMTAKAKTAGSASALSAWPVLALFGIGCLIVTAIFALALVCRPGRRP